MTSVRVNGKELARAVNNILKLVSPATNDPVSPMDYALLSLQPGDDEHPASLMIVGATHYMACVEEIPLMGDRVDEAVSVAVAMGTPGAKSTGPQIDRLSKCYAGISAASKKADDTVDVAIEQDALLRLSSGTKLLGELEGREASMKPAEYVLSLVDAEAEQLIGPVMLDTALLARFKDVRGSEGGTKVTDAPKIDIAGVLDRGGKGGIMVFKVGETLSGAMSTVERHTFANPGEWADNYARGTPRMLLKG